MTEERQQDPFGPIELVVSVLLALVLAAAASIALIAGVQLVAHGHTSVSFANIGGDTDTCVLADGDGRSVPSYTASGDGYRPSEGIDGLRRRSASAMAETWNVCLEHPSVVQWAGARVQPVGEVVLIVVGLLLVRRVIRAARRSGLFTPRAAQCTRQLGWFLLLYGLLFPVLAAAGRGVVISAAVRGVPWTRELGHPHVSVLLVLVALGILTFARILRLAVPLQEEVDATV